MRLMGKEKTVGREFLTEQLPLIVITFGLGIALSYVQHGFLIGGSRGVPLAGNDIYVPIWHLLWMGLWTGYAMGVVGEATGIFSLPYSMSILQFNSVHISPTDLVVTFLNPFGALFGFRREKQWNLDLAIWLCIGAAVGAQIGPFLRVHYLSDPVPFKAAVGLALLFLGGHLIYEATPRHIKSMPSKQRLEEKFALEVEQRLKNNQLPSGLPEDIRIHTVEKNFRVITIEFWGERWTLSVPILLGIGLGVGIVASTFGVGGGFLLVSILTTFFHLPMYVLVAATIPFVITLSAMGLISYTLTVPLLSGNYVAPEWAWGFFVASAAICGSWAASKTQKFVPEKSLKVMLGVLTGAIGLIYLLNYLTGLPFKV